MASRRQRFFFHVYNSVDDTYDEEGSEFADLDAVRQYAIKAIRALLSHEITQGYVDLRGRIEVTDASGDRLLTLPFAEAVAIYPPAGTTRP